MKENHAAEWLQGPFPEYQSTRATPAAIDSCTRLPRTPLFLQSSRHSMSLSDSICKRVGNKENWGFSLPPKRWGCTSSTVPSVGCTQCPSSAPTENSSRLKSNYSHCREYQSKNQQQNWNQATFLTEKVCGGEFFCTDLPRCKHWAPAESRSHGLSAIAINASEASPIPATPALLRTWEDRLVFSKLASAILLSKREQIWSRRRVS
jgi:hypothetical protein